MTSDPAAQVAEYDDAHDLVSHFLHTFGDESLDAECSRWLEQAITRHVRRKILTARQQQVNEDAKTVESWADRIGGFEAQQLAKELRNAK